MRSDGSPQSAHELLYHQDVIRRVLALSEDLGRHDENLARWHLLSKAVPYFVAEHPAIVAERDGCYQGVKHVLPREELRAEDRDSDPYAAYYASNVNERPFEEQYGIGVEQAHRLPRVQFLLDGLEKQADVAAGFSHDQFDIDRSREFTRVLDLSANDGFMAARLSLAGYTCDCLDLHPGNVQIARERKAQFPLIGRVEQGALENALRPFGDEATGHLFDEHAHDAVVCFETVEHVRDPHEMLAVMSDICSDTGRLYLSTPAGACEQGAVDEWRDPAPKGHVRVYTAASFRALLETVGVVEELVEGEDRVLVARVRPAPPPEPQ